MMELKHPKRPQPPPNDRAPFFPALSSKSDLVPPALPLTHDAPKPGPLPALETHQRRSRWGETDVGTSIYAGQLPSDDALSRSLRPQLKNIQSRAQKAAKGKSENPRPSEASPAVFFDWSGKK